MELTRPTLMARPAAGNDTILYLVLFGFISLALLNAFFVDKHLSADGAHYFTTILDNGAVTRVDPARAFAETLIQWPLVLAVKAGVTEVPLLVRVFALGIYLPYALSFALCLYAVRGESTALLALPVLSMASLNLPADYILAGEHHVMILLAWPILLLILRREPPNTRDGLLLVVSLLVFSRTYQTAVVPALLFAVLLCGRLYADRDNRRATVFRGIALALAIATIVVGALSIASPRDAVNRDFFRESLPAIVTFPELFLPAAFSVLFLPSLASRRRVIQLLPLAPLLLYAFFVLGREHGLSALQSFSARTLSVTLLPALLLGTVVVHAKVPSLGGSRKAMLVGMVLAVSSASIRHSADWSSYRRDMIEILRTERGYVTLEGTVLDHDPCRWAWTSPELSVIWSYPTVRAIVRNRHDERSEPFDPRRTLVLKRYVRYDPVFADVDPGARIERPGE